MIYAVGTVARCKYYFAWAISEAALIFSGFCFNGYNDQEQARWDRYSNTRIRKVELCTSAAELAAHWNTCTGTFLRQCMPLTSANCQLLLQQLSALMINAGLSPCHDMAMCTMAMLARYQLRSAAQSDAACICSPVSVTSSRRRVYLANSTCPTACKDALGKLTVASR